MEFTIHPAAEMQPLSTVVEYERLKTDIATNKKGQHNPIIVCRGAIIDGRHRYRACTELSIPVKYTELPEDTAEEELYSYVRSVAANHRERTPTQRACVAYKDHKQTGLTMATSAKLHGVSKKLLVGLSTLSKYNETWIDVLFQGLSVRIYDLVNIRFVTTNKIGTLTRVVASNKEQESGGVITNTQYESDRDYLSEITTSIGRGRFCEITKEQTYGVALKEVLVEYCNLKYSVVT